MNGWFALGEEGPPLLRRQLAPDERMVGGDRRGHPLLDLREVGRGQRAVELEVVVEAVGDRRPDPELGPREELEDGLGHDVGGRVAHRVEIAVGAGVEELVGRAALGRLEEGLLLDRLDRPARRPSRVLQESQNLSSMQDERFDPPAVPPAFAARAGSGASSRTRGRANGRIPDRFAGRSRVVPGSSIAAGLAAWARLSGGAGDGPVPIVAFKCGGRHWTRTSDLLHVKQVL